jgi:hypothetical protein
VTNPRYTGEREDLLRGRDIAALVLAEDAGVAPVPLARGRESGEARVIGFGPTSTDPETRGSRTSAAARVGAICAGRMTIDGAMACHGDSGGPVMVNGEVAAVISYGDGPLGSSDPPAYAARVEPYARWLDTLDRDCKGCPSKATCEEAPPHPPADGCAVGGSGPVFPFLALLLLGRRLKRRA